MTSAPRTALAAAALVVLALAGCSPAEPEPTETPAASATPDAAASEEPTPTPTPDEPVLDESERAAIVEGVETGEPAAIGPHMSDPVTYILASSECCGPVTPVDALSELLSYTAASSGWTTDVDPAYLDQVRASPYYADYVPADVIAMKATSDDLVVIFGITGDRITSVLVGWENVLLFT